MGLTHFAKKISTAFSALVLCLCFVGSAQAAVPRLMTYQGVLKDGSGNYLTGTYSMVFRLYSASTGGSALWSETQSSVTTSSGKFSVQLGSVTSLGSLDFNSNYWLSIQVGSDAEMSPRVQLTSMGYGIRSDYENNGFTQSAHDALSHKNVEAFKEDSTLIAKTNFKLDAYSVASANSMGDMIVDTFNDASGIDSGSSSGYSYRGSANFDVIATPGGIDSNAKLALHGNGTDASTTMTDSSSGSKTVTANGNAQIDTAQSKFGGASILFDGSGDFLTVPDSADWNFGSGPFTIDLWVRFNSFSNVTELLSQGNGSDYMDLRVPSGGGSIRFSAGNDVFSYASPLSGSYSFSTGTWYHIAVIRGWNGNANDYAITVNGSAVATGTDSSTYPDYNGELGIGSLHYGPGTEEGSPYYLNGWIDELRITKGVARWTSNFTPPAAEYSSSGGSATVISNAYSEPSAPTQALVVADETLNTGSIAYSVSRDNGTTWTSCTKETVTDISSQPSGTQLKWKAAITGDAELNSIAVAT